MVYNSLSMSVDGTVNMMNVTLLIKLYDFEDIVKVPHLLL